MIKTIKLIKVKAGEGLMVHFPTRVITAPGARTLVIQGDQVAEVDPNQLFVIKRLRVGDLVIVKETAIERPKINMATSKGKK